MQTRNSRTRSASRLAAALLTPIAAVLVAVALVVPAAFADGAASLEGECSLYRVATGRSPRLALVNGNGEFVVTKQRSRLRVWHDGERVPERNLDRQGPILRVTDDDGQMLVMVGVFTGFSRDGQLVYSPDLDPYSLLNRFGLKTDEPDDDLAEHLDLDPRRVLAVDEVCAGRPAERAGLRRADVILGIAGERALDAVDLERRVAAQAAGDSVELEIGRQGGVQRVELVAGPVGEWPSDEELASHLRRVVNEFPQSPYASDARQRADALQADVPKAS